MSVKYWMEDYLRKEYGKEFVVNRVGYIPSYYGDGLKIKGIAHPKDDPSLKFDIVRDASGGVFGEYPIYGESYIRDLWEKQKTEEIKTILDSDVVFADIFFTHKREELYGRTISVHEAEQLFKNRMELYISYGLFVSIEDYFKQFDEFENFIDGKLSKEQSENLFGIIKKLKNNNYKMMKLEIRCFNSKYEKKINKNPKWYLYATVLDFRDLPPSERSTLLCSFRLDDINYINKPEDVKRFINLNEGYLYHDNSKD